MPLPDLIEIVPLEKPVQADILQESFINTVPAWINMLA